jgi:hypothetical protein
VSIETAEVLLSLRRVDSRSDREAWLSKAPEPKSTYREWFANKLLLDSTVDPSDPAWRLQLLSWATTVAQALLDQAALLCGEQRMQTLITLQSAPGCEELDFDYATGALFFFSVRDTIDDYSLPAHMDPSPEGQGSVTARDDPLPRQQPEHTLIRRETPPP